MSIEPEAHEWLRHRAYKRWGSLPRAERNAAEIAAWGEAQLRPWRDGRPDGHDLADAQLRATAKGIATYMVTTYGQRSKRAPSKTTFESRALHRHALRVSADMMAEEWGVEALSARRVSDLLGNSRSTTARALSAVRGKPKRQAAAAKLSPNGAKLWTIVESILPGDGERVVRVADLVERMWPKADADVKPGTARVRRKRLLDTIGTLAPLSIYAKAEGDLVALIRGRRWTEEAAAARLKAGASDPGRQIAVIPVPLVGGPFWTSLEARCLVAVLCAESGSPLYGYKFSAFVSQQTLLRDTRPLARAYQRALDDAEGGAAKFPDFVRRILSDRSARSWRFEPAARAALITAASHMERLYEDGRWGRPALEAIDYACREFARLRNPASGERQARIEAFKEIVNTATDARGHRLDCVSALLLCERLAIEEAADRWSAEPYLNPDCPF